MDESKSFYKEYSDLGEKDSHFLIIEVEGEIENAVDLRNLVEKLGYSGLGMSSILSLKEMGDLFLHAEVTKWFK